MQVSEIKKLVSPFQYQTLDSSKLVILRKILKTAKLTITNHVVLSRINMKLLAANTHKKQQVQYTNLQYDGQKACILSLQNLEKRK